MTKITIIMHNIRSAYNVGSVLRACEGFGVTQVYCTGYTPYPLLKSDKRLPHISQKIDRKIHKTALGAERLIDCLHQTDCNLVITELKQKGYQVVGLEQSPRATPLPSFTPPDKLALLVGNEVDGIAPVLLDICDRIIEIPMYGQKESFNVSQATAIALYALRHT